MLQLSADGSTVSRPPPVVVGGIGGSGTRVVVQLLQSAGVCMGNRLNASLDMLDFVPQFEAHIQSILSVVRSASYSVADIAAAERTTLFTALKAIIAGLEQEAGGRAWGWKNPRIIYLLPFVHALVPQMRFVHVVRDGRDMALSGNQNQLRTYGRDILGNNATDAVAAVRFWQVVNMSVMAWCQRHLPGRYLCLRYEDLLHAPCSSAAILLEFIAPLRPTGAATDSVAIERWRAGLRASPGIGRWQSLTPSLQHAIGQASAEGLAHFGYQPAASGLTLAT